MLSKFDIVYATQKVIKGYMLAYFLVNQPIEGYGVSYVRTFKSKCFHTRLSNNQSV